MKRKTLILTVIAAGLVVAATSAAVGIYPNLWFSRAKSEKVSLEAPSAQAELPARVPALPVGTQPNYRAIVERYGPAVVGVVAEGLHTTGPNEQLDLNDPFLRFFRGLPGFPWRLPEPEPGGSQPFSSQGSGFIISADGLILTNAHVVREAKAVKVKLSDRREFSARVLGADTLTDTAVLRIDAQNLPVVVLGDAQQLQVGDPVLAIGSPFGFEQTATQGIVSAKGRSLPGDAAVPFIQTDAAVNPGNSGGPLFDGSGAVVGINAQIYSRSGGFQGLSFAIPINVALKVKDQIVATGRASHARLGVTVQDLNQTLATSFGLDRPDGALIAQVLPDSAAASAGLRAGDVVTEFNGEKIGRSGDLSSRIGLAAPGETAKLKVWRDRGALDMTVKLGRAEDSLRTPMPRESQARAGQLGLTLRPLNPQEEAQLQRKSGLVVEGVSGAAARARVVPGDVLLAINGVPVKSVDQVARMLDKKPKTVALLIYRDGEQIYIPVNLD